MATTALLAFGYAVQHVPLTLIGVLRFLTPTIQVCIAVFVYHEQFSLIHSVGFVLPWTALVTFTTHNAELHNPTGSKEKDDLEPCHRESPPGRRQNHLPKYLRKVEYSLYIKSPS
ncbi:hypothetical protein Ae201684P_012366 [Aphanomyces euteiches]|uniref:EamA domain-containing protein n=1 Tax=Aphanomyces euteiches TaxID=100861 RepID=A0A6G0WZ31_9STRA|nr:hypothetical protein Ae201684_010118 [Aphanomyces euteiches]KAH9075873.1 hypothetical protein Ae201684P_012366 [Aphanomyces euteiches]